MQLSNDSVVVGIDGSDSARAAARFALTHFPDAKDFILATVIADGTQPTLPAPSDVTTPYTASLPAVTPSKPSSTDRERAEAMVRDLATELTHSFAEVVVTTRVLTGDAAEQLEILSENAGLLVIGHHGSDQPTVGRIGTTSQGLPGHALCPVLIYREDAKGDAVVVGMDTSEYASVAALDAADFATRHNLPLRVIVGVDPLGDSERARTQTELDLTWLRSEVPGLNVSVEYAQGTPADILGAASAKAALLVMGKRGLSAFAGMAVQLGRTVGQVIQKAESSVLLSTFRDDPRLANRRIVD